MILQLNVLQDGSCARIFASREFNEETWECLSHIKIWHNKGKKSIEKMFRQPVWYENDYVIQFKSQMSFRSFCEQFNRSEYNNGDNYRIYTHNCANAAEYALKIAGIDLKIPKIKLTSLCPHPITRLPTPVLSPIDLFHYAKSYYESQEAGFTADLKKTNHLFQSMSFKFELANKALFFWGNKQKVEKIKLASNGLYNAMRKHQDKNPHRAPIYLQKLYDSIDLMFLEDPNLYPSSLLFNTNHIFKNRRTFYATQEADIRVNLCLSYLLLYSCCYFLFLFMYTADPQEEAPITALSSLLFVGEIILNLCVGGVIALGSEFYAIKRDNKRSRHETHDTHLSNAIEAYEKSIHEYIDTTEKSR